MTESGRKIFNMVLAILVSIVAWVFVVYNYDPMTQVKYPEVAIKFTGESELAARGLAVDEASAETVAVTLSQRRIDASKIDASDINVTANVEDCVAGGNSVAIRVVGPNGTSVTGLSISEVNVNVSRAKSEARDIEVVYGEGAEENEEPIAFDLSQTRAEISCSADRLGEVDKVAAVLKYENMTDTVKSFTVDLAALDREGAVIPHVVINPEEISLDASAGVTKTVSLDLTIKDDSDDGYERKASVPSTVTVKGAEDVISGITSITASDIDISKIYADQDIRIDYDLPEGVYIANESLYQRVKVKVTEKTEDE